jgi:hypothetical protein
MRSVTDAALLPIRGALPDWCDRFLAPPGGGDVFASRLWYEAILAHAWPSNAEPLLARCGDVLLLPLMRQDGRLRAMVTPYTLEWPPARAAGAIPGCRA